MVYVMSDLHGEYEKYLKMLDLIQFSEQDNLYILGDIVDRGPQPVKILRDMMLRENVFPIMGNHDLMAIYLLENLNVDITEENQTEHLSIDEIQDVLNWMQEGGDTTISGFQKLSIPERTETLEYMKEFPLYDIVEIKEKIFILVHAGLGNFRPGKKLSQYSAEELLLTRDNPDIPYFKDPNIYVITGHTPTYFISGKSEIYHSGNRFCIDCGASFSDGKLACLCLNTLQEFYI